MQVPVRADELDLHVAQAAQASGDARNVVGDDAGVADEHHIGRELVAVVLQESIKVVAADFFLALHDELEVDGLLAGLDHGLEGLDVHEHLALVVAGAAGEDGTLGMQLRFADDGFEGW